MLLRSIQARLLGLVLATVVPLAALIGVGLWNQWQRDQARAIESAITEARLLAAQVDDHIGELELLLAGLSRSVSANSADVNANIRLLRKVKAELPPFIGNISLFALDGSYLGSSGDPGLEHPSVADRKYFQEILDGKRLGIGDVIRSRADGQWVINIARPVQGEAGRLAAVIVIGTWLEHFQDALRLHDLRPGSVVTVSNERGIVVARNFDAPAWIGRDVSNWRNHAQGLAPREGSVISRWTQVDNQEHITGFSTAHRVPWRVSVALPRTIAFAAVATRLQWSALFIAATLVLAWAIAWMLSARIVRPLRQLGKDASRLASGELAHRATVRTRDEVEALADTFNSMAESLEQRDRELRKSKNTLAAVIDASPVAIACSNPEHRVILWSRASEQIFGYTAREMLGRQSLIIPFGEVAESRRLFERALKGETVRDIETVRRRKDGTLVDVRIAFAPMYDLDGTVRGVAKAYEDITKRKEAEQRLKRIAHYDQLTGLPNRPSLQKRLGGLLAGEGPLRSTALALFDLDGFKDVNDTLGHPTGDELLVEVAQRLASATGDLRDRETVYRLGGDEFVVIMPDCGDPRPFAALVDTILEDLSTPFEINGQVLHVGASAGIAIAPHDGVTADELIANADLALYQAKAAGGHVYRLFVPAFRAQAQARRGLEVELRRAFAEDEFELYFQPQIRLGDEAVVGAEALLRWRHPAQGILAPGAFIDTLAKSDIALGVGRWIIHTACERAAAWRASGLPITRIGVNLFPTQAGAPGLPDDIEAALRRSGLPADVLELEITENAAFNFDDPSPPLQKVHELGVRLAFDDFGTGYASLNYLTRFPVSRIKIDRSFVEKITANTKDAPIVSSLIAMAHELGLKVIAEGVETHAQAAFLLKEGCEEAQGFLYSRPLPADEFECYLERRRLVAKRSLGAA